MKWKATDFEVSDSAKAEVARIMEPYSSEAYCPMLSYGNTSFKSSSGKVVHTPNCWRVYANEFERLNTAPSYYEASGVKLYVASPQMIKSGSVLEFVDGQFVFQNRT